MEEDTMLKKFLASTALVAALAAPAAFAQTTPASPPATSNPPANLPSASSSTMKTSDANQSVMRPNEWRASKWIGSKVYGADDKSIGDVNDLVFDHNSGQITEAVLSVGGFLGIGDLAAI